MRDWSLRSRYILTDDDDGTRNAESIYTYAEHVFVPQRSDRRKWGEINAVSSVLNGVPITGVQILPTNGLQKNNSGVIVSGIARTPQARGNSTERPTDI